MNPEDGDDRLTSEEITALTSAFSDPMRGASPDREAPDAVVLRYDLVGAANSQRHDYPALDLLHETYALELATALQRETKQEAVFLPQRPDVLNFSEVYASLASPCAVVTVEVSGLACTGLLIVEPSLLLHFVDLLMGGPGGLVDAAQLLTARSFTNTERHLIRRLVGFVDSALREAWREISPIGVRMLRAEVDPRHAALFMPSDRVAELRLDVEWGEVVGDLRVVLPMAALRPFERDLSRTAVAPPNPTASAWQGEMRAAIQRVEVDLVAVLGDATMTLRDLLELQPGDLVRLDRDPDGHLDLHVQDVAKLAVRPSVRQGNMAVTVVGPLEEPESSARVARPGVGVAGPGGAYVDDDADAHDDDDDDDDDDLAPGDRPTPLPSLDEQV